MINIKDLGLEHRDNFIFYACKDFIIYKDNLNIVKKSCSGEILTTLPCPNDFRHYEFTTEPNSITLILNGKHYINFKNDNSANFHDMEVQCITKIHNFFGQLVFGTRDMNRVQFLRYDPNTQKRVCQTASWNMKKLNFVMRDHFLLGAVDEIFVICANMMKGEILWTKLETGRISRIFSYLNGLLYASQGILRFADNGKINPIKVPFTKADNIVHINGDNIYLTTNDSKNLCCFNIENRKVYWEISGGGDAIGDGIITKADNKDIFVAKTGLDISLFDLNSGVKIYTIPSPQCLKIRKTGESILIHKEDDSTDIIPEV